MQNWWTSTKWDLQVYSNKQIAWLNYIAPNENIHIQHVNNSHKLGAGEVEIPIQAHMEYKRVKALQKWMATIFSPKMSTSFTDAYTATGPVK